MGGSGYLFDYIAYIHYGPWVMGPVVPLKHLSTNSGSLKRVQNRYESTQIETYTYWDASLGGSGYLFDYIAFIHYGP